MDILTKPRSDLRWYLELTIGTAGATLVAWAIYTIPPQWLVQTAGLIAAAAAMTPLSIRLTDPVRLPGAMFLEMTVLLVAPPSVSILVAASVALFTSIRYRRPLLRTFSNMGNLALPNGLGALILATFLAPWPQPIALPHHLPVVALAIGARMLANLLGVTAILHLEGRLQFGRYIRESVRDEVTDGGFALRLLPVVLAVAFSVSGWWVLVLGAAIQCAVSASMKRYQDRIAQQTLVDGLTNLENRTAWERYHRSILPSAPNLLAVVDVDGLKATNDSHGHELGDAILIDLARRLHAAADGGRVFRIGGDEFVVSLTQQRLWPGSIRALQQAVAEYSHYWRGRDLPVSASIGIAEAPREAPDLTEALRLADRRMYQAKGHQRQ